MIALVVSGGWTVDTRHSGLMQFNVNVPIAQRGCVRARRSGVQPVFRPSSERAYSSVPSHACHLVIAHTP